VVNLFPMGGEKIWRKAQEPFPANVVNGYHTPGRLGKRKNKCKEEPIKDLVRKAKKDARKAGGV